MNATQSCGLIYVDNRPCVVSAKSIILFSHILSVHGHLFLTFFWCFADRSMWNCVVRLSLYSNRLLFTETVWNYLLVRSKVGSDETNPKKTNTYLLRISVQWVFVDLLALITHWLCPMCELSEHIHRLPLKILCVLCCQKSNGTNERRETGRTHKVVTQLC